MLVIVALVFPVSWALADILRRPKEAFASTGPTRGIWIALLVVALLGPLLVGTSLIGLLASSGIGIWYLVAVRPKVAAATASPTPPADER